jgi:hypothetical protein
MKSSGHITWRTERVWESPVERLWMNHWMATESQIGKICPYCQTAIQASEKVFECPDCGMPHHAECWAENGGCTTFGCADMPKPRRPASVSVDVADDHEIVKGHLSIQTPGVITILFTLVGLLVGILLGSGTFFIAALLGALIGVTVETVVKKR